MTDTQNQIPTSNPIDEAAFNMALLDPNALEEPKERFPVIVRVSNLRWSDPKYNAATSFRQAFPYRGPGYGPEGNSIQQWDLQLERLDAIYYHEDGSPFEGRNGAPAAQTVPVIVYAGIDLQKMDKNGIVQDIKKTRGKEPFTLSAWTKVAGSLFPSPAVLVGKQFLVERYREKEIAPGFFAKNVTVPVEVLAPTFVYSGEILRFKAGRETSDGAVGAAVSNAAAPVVDKQEAASLIAAFLINQGIDRNKADVSLLSLPDFPATARIEPFLTACALGDLAATLATFNV